MRLETFGSMTLPQAGQGLTPSGIVLRGLASEAQAVSQHTPQSSAQSAAKSAAQSVLEALGQADLAETVRFESGRDQQGPWLRLWLDEASVQAWAPAHNTLLLCQNLQLDSVNQAADLVREIVIALLMGPIAFEYPSLDELLSAIRIRSNIVQAARKTTLDFKTEEAERPADCWTYDEETGFTLLPGVNLIEALIKATQPEVSGRLYSFSCYRATEYVTLLGIAQELALSNPHAYEHLQMVWCQRAIMSEEFHEVFLREQGSLAHPLPPLFYVPGDRVWFRNPDEASADATGFEGSWVMYLGAGLFTNFWQERQQYTLQEKCVEIYHWRHGLYRDAKGEACIDEERIKPMVAATLADPGELDQVMRLMTRYREPRGVYTEAGGCIDATREFARWVRPGTADMVLPEQ